MGRGTRGRYPSRHVEHEVEGPVGFSGWLYSDLLLGLAVVFLATVTFIAVADTPDDGIPRDDGGGEPEEPFEDDDPKPCVRGLALESIKVTVQFDPAAQRNERTMEAVREVVEDIEEVDFDTLEIGMMLAFSSGTTPSRGSDRSRVFLQDLTWEALPPMDGPETRRAYYTGGLSPTQIRLELFPYVMQCEGDEASPSDEP